jgi:hypothetical protein
VRRAIWTIGLLAGCWGDKAVEVSLLLPTAATAAMYDTSCVTAIEIFANGGNYPTDRADYLRDCIDITSPAATYAELREQIRGKFDMKLPGSGLSSIELYGYNGTCTAASAVDYDLLMYGSVAYTGQDSISLPITPNLSCAQNNYTIRPIDFLKYVKTQNCAMSAWTEGKIGLSTLSPIPFTGETFWWGGQASAPATTGLVSLRGLAEGIGPKSCLAASLYTDDWYQVTCMPPADQRVCASGPELEAVMISLAVGFDSWESTKINRWGSVVYGAVMGPGPIANATIEIDEADKDKGEVVFYDMPPGVENGAGTLMPRTGTTTSASGLFGIYTQSMLRVTITANGKSVKRLIAADDENLSAVIVKL